MPTHRSANAFARGARTGSNGSRLYYANLTANLNIVRSEAAFKGFEAIAVSRTDNVAAAAANDKNAWMAPVLVSKQSSTTFSDKEQIWADNAASSPFFGHTYLCWASCRSQERGLVTPAPLVVATSTDGGSTWTQKQVTSASNTPFNPKQGFGRSGCTVRTDSHGLCTSWPTSSRWGCPGTGRTSLIKSYDGGKTWTRPRVISQAVDTCFLVQFDGTGYRCVEDGVGGARDDLSSAPSIDIANGAPTGTDATNVLYRTWVDGRAGPDIVHVFVSYSTNGGNT